MKFHRIDIDGFGVLAQTTLDGLNGQLNVVYGPNGAGKSTLLHFLKGVYCGYDEGRRLGLMPPVGGGPGGGSVVADWQGDVCRFTRTSETESDHKLRVTLDRNGRHTAHPRFAGNEVPAALLPMLYMVGHADVHALDRLVEKAIDDGIDLITRGDDSLQLASTSTGVHAHRAELEDEADKVRIAELTGQRQRLQAELEELTRQLRERCDQLTRAHNSRQQSNREQAWKTVQWLQTELQAAECDLREAEDRAWQPSSTHQRTQRVTMTLPTQPKRQASTSHLDVSRRVELEAIDERIIEARTTLIDIAQRRLEVSLGAARIAGSEDLQSGELLTVLRESLQELEGTILELRDDSQNLSRDRDVPRCQCKQWATTTRTAVEEMRRRLYGICEQVSRFELHHNKMFYSAVSEELDQEEHEQLQLVQSLREQRQAIVESTGNLETWQGPSQRCVEHELCECSDHWEYQQRLVRPQPVPAATTTVVVERPLPVATIIKPTAEQLRRLRQRRDDLRTKLEAARVHWRTCRLQSSPFTLPEDVRALEERIDLTRVELDTIERELISLQERAHVLLLTGEVIRRAVQRVEQDGRPQAIRWAGAYLSRLTGGRYVDLRVTPEHHDLRVVDREGTERPRWTLSRGTLDQVALSLRLALVRAYADKGINFPMVMDDVLVDCDIDRLQEAVRLLCEFAVKHDQQIIYLTCGTHLASLFHSEGTTPITMPGSLADSWTRDESVKRPANWTIRGWVDQTEVTHRSSESPSAPIKIVEEAHFVRVPEQSASAPAIRSNESRDTSSRQRVSPGSDSDRVRLTRPLNRRQPGGQFWLSMDSPLMLVPSIGDQMGHRLVALGIRTVEELIELPADQEVVPLKTLQISESRLRDWQAEAILLCCVPDLTGQDAQLLVACGVRTPQQLAQIDVDQLVHRLSRLPQDQWGRHRREGWPSRDAVQRWIHNGRHARSHEDARRSTSKHNSVRRPFSRRQQSETSSSGTRIRIARTGHSRRDHSDQRQHETQVAAHTTPFVTASTDESGDWKFYLSPESPVVDAPSIGPKMAMRLERIGIVTVSDLLARNAAKVAERLDHKRVKEETVVMWQQQSRLMCRIPHLRGHDAQVLVACDITQPEQVSGMDPRALFGIIGPFVETVEGQRLLRSSKTPDLEEVTEWIRWANHARPLKAA
ncbi:MAG: DUF4332 domain-containing protein [Planctomycetaceae bacterium]|nr:DUF4332 domain-containing protein [Planctomycetaceae bacterium]